MGVSSLLRGTMQTISPAWRRSDGLGAAPSLACPGGDGDGAEQSSVAGAATDDGKYDVVDQKADRSRRQAKAGG